MIYGKWISRASMALWVAGWLAAGNVSAAADGYTLEDLKLNSAGALVDICTIDPTHEDYTAGQAFCYGFFEGAIRYAEALAGSESHRKLVCAPPGTTRLEAVQVYVSFMNENPQYVDEGPIDAIYRALMPRWPCAQ